jgi:hypothetical protein
MKRRLCVMVALTITASIAGSCSKESRPISAIHAQDLPAGVMEIPLSDIKWIPAANGLDHANLLGDPDKPGPYLQLVRWPAHKRLTAHKHPDARYGVVISGVHWATGTSSTRGSCESIPQAHFSVSPPWSHTSARPKTREPFCISMEWDQADRRHWSKADPHGHTAQEELAVHGARRLRSAAFAPGVPVLPPEVEI